MTPERPSLRVRRLAGAATIVLGIWSAWLAVFGGVTIRIFGGAIRSNSVQRPAYAFIACLVVWAALADRAAIFARARALLSNRRSLWIATLLAAAVVALTLAYGSRVVGGSDSYGYASEADLILNGQITLQPVPLPAVPWPTRARPFIPLGYYEVPNAQIGAPKYPPGFPLLLAPFKVAFGQWGFFIVVPLLAGATVLLTFLIGRELTSRGTALGAALLLAASPIFLYQGMQLMSDLPAAAALAAVCYAALRPGWRAAIAGGVCASMAMMIRPNLAPVIALVGLWYVSQMRRASRDRVASIGVTGWMRVAAFGIAAALGPIVLAAVNHHIFGSALHSGYGDISDYFEWSRVIDNARLYGSWIAHSQTPLPIAGALLLLAPSKAFWPAARDRAAVVLFGLIVAGLWLEYCLYYTFGVWWFLRFLLPAWPLMMIGAAQALRWAADRVPGVLVPVAAIAVCVYGGWFAAQNFTFDLWHMQRGFYTVAQGVRRNVDRGAVIYTYEESGSLRYYSGLVTFNYIDMPPEDVDASVDFFAAHGAHPYLLVEDWETDVPGANPTAPKRFTAAVARKPLFVHDGASVTRLYDLAPGDSAPKPTELVHLTFDGPRCPSTVAPRPLVLDLSTHGR